jgi:hypothetical protein
VVEEAIGPQPSGYGASTHHGTDSDRCARSARARTYRTYRTCPIRATAETPHWRKVAAGCRSLGQGTLYGLASTVLASRSAQRRNSD